MTRLHTIGRRYRSASKYTFARPSEIIGVHLCTREPEVPSTRYERWNPGKGGTLARVVPRPVARCIYSLPSPRGKCNLRFPRKRKSRSTGEGNRTQNYITRFFWNRFYIVSLYSPSIHFFGRETRRKKDRCYVLHKQRNDLTRLFSRYIHRCTSIHLLTRIIFVVLR